MKKNTVLCFFIAQLILVISCSKITFKPVNEDKNRKLINETKNEDKSFTASCDSALWEHVWDSSRLEVIDKCKEVTGTIEELSAQDDGDAHMLLKLDAGQENLLKPKNITKKEGDLVIEVICANEITKKKAKEPCEGYLNQIKLPETGQHVKVTGSYVIDSNNGWAEIHPVTKIEVIK